MPSDDEAADVLAANHAFYDAFASRDNDAMAAVWSRDAQVSCIHPGWDILIGPEPVLGSWRDILTAPEAPQIACRDATVRMLGDAAIVLCREVIGNVVLAATNLFVHAPQGWQMIHHQAGQIAQSNSSAPEHTVH